MPFLEKSNWVVLIVAVPTVVLYLVLVVPQVLGGPIGGVSWVQPMIATIVGLVLAMAGADRFWIANAIYAGGVTGACLSSATKIAAYHGPFQRW